MTWSARSAARSRWPWCAAGRRPRLLIAAGFRRLAGPGGGGAAGAPGRSPPAAFAQSPAYNAALAVLAAASFGVTELLVKGILHAGGFYLRAIPAGSQISHWATVPAQLHALAENLLILFGANFWGLPQPQAAFAYLHLICLALALVGLVVSIARWRTADRVTRALVVGIIVMLAAGAASPLMIIVGGTHEIAVVLPLGAALGGRVVGPWLAARAGSGQFARAGRRARATAAGVLAAAGLGLLCCLGYAAAQPARPPHDAAIADWLLAHHLTSGLSGYWNANITTLITGGEVHLAPVTSGGTYGYLWESKESWFDPHVSSREFHRHHHAAAGRRGRPLEGRPGLVRQAGAVLPVSASTRSWSTTATCWRPPSSRCRASSRRRRAPVRRHPSLGGRHRSPATARSFFGESPIALR